MPSVSSTTTGGHVAVDIVAASANVTWKLNGLSLSCAGAAGTVAIKIGTALMYTLTVPAAGAAVVHIAPTDQWEFPAAEAANKAITITPSADGIVASYAVNYSKVF